MDDAKPMWTRLPEETERQFTVFQRYLHMLDDPEESRRSLHRLAITLGYKNEKALEVWSSRNRWVERAAAYDDYMSVAIVQREIQDLGAYQQHVVERLTEQLAAMDRVLQAEISRALKTQEEGKAVASIELKRLLEAIKIADDLARRTARMPTTYITEVAPEEDLENRVYLVGA